ncbi:unnamed protein product [Spirodela intermedia]|uniref:Uncharacterized protein n=1 Tax=Spirodela intermedia TaxID=51605 RepID=A0A7I8L8M7_SPIIN|nr:unnamed protein product [Spirodela intermedia]
MFRPRAFSFRTIGVSGVSFICIINVSRLIWA